ncbi:hypothetical protein FRC17_000123 [Serendipita sp. 399]|nr:hypothetical protein FRC17_000123 [Serendipita sp. 399]
MSLHSPSVLVTPPMRATKPLDEQDAVLEALMEDYIRATELQKSLKKRIKAAMKEKEEKAKQEEEVARLLLIQAEEKTARVRRLNQQLQYKMGRAGEHEEEDDEFPAGMAIGSLKLSSAISRRSMVDLNNPIISPRAMSPTISPRAISPAMTVCPEMADEAGAPNHTVAKKKNASNRPFFFN